MTTMSATDTLRTLIGARRLGRHGRYSEPDTVQRRAIARLDMPLLDAMMTQRAVRRVLPDPVDDAVVLKCIELALRAPTGSNGQNWEFLVVKDQRQSQLAKRYRQAWALYGGVGASASPRATSP